MTKTGPPSPLNGSTSFRRGTFYTYKTELVELQWKQQAFDDEDLKADMATKQCARNYTNFENAATDRNSKQGERKEFVKNVRYTLKEYHKVLLADSMLASLPPPSKRVLCAFRIEFFNESLGSKSFPTLGGHSAGLYDNLDDLVTLRAPEDQDQLTSFVQEHLGILFPVSE